jgi:hypothetical protein
VKRSAQLRRRRWLIQDLGLSAGRHADTKVAESKRRIADLVVGTGTTLTGLHGAGPPVAARSWPRSSTCAAT